MASTAKESTEGLLCVGRRKGVLEVYAPHSQEVCARTELQHSHSIYITPLPHSPTEQCCLLIDALSLMHVAFRLPKLLAVAEDGYLHVMRFQRKCEHVLSEGTVRHPTKLKAVRRIQAAEQITTAVSRFCAAISCLWVVG